jgi:hypothetical protein
MLFGIKPWLRRASRNDRTMGHSAAYVGKIEFTDFFP